MLRRLLLAALIVGAAPVWARDCSIAHYNFAWGTDTQTTMTVKSGSPCVSTITARSSILSSNISQPAAHGSASIVDSHRWGYRSKTGYQGSDRFVVSLDGQANGGRFSRQTSGETKIDVDVNVVP